MRTLLVLMVGLTASCGRFGFNEQTPPDPTVDSGTPTPDSETFTTLIACDNPERFQIGATGITALRAFPTTTGFGLLTVDSTTNLAGHAYEWDPTGLTMTASNIAIDANATPTIAATASGDDVLVSTVSVTKPTRIHPRTNQLDDRGVPITHATIAADGALAANNGAIVYVHAAGLGYEAQRLSVAGDAVGGPLPLIAAAEGPNQVSIISAGSGFAVTWSEAAASPNGMRLALFDAQLNIAAGPVTANTSGNDAGAPRIAWASASNTYLITWFEKTANGMDDDVWFQIRDGQLAPVTPAMFLGGFAVNPVVASDGTDFWVTWLDYGASPDVLAGTRITASGTMTPAPIMSSGGTPAHYSMLARDGQAVLAWAESGGNGPDLWLAAMCP